VIDKDNDGEITINELRKCYEELGKSVKDAELKSMMAEVNGPLNFSTFINLFGEKLNGN
jgi:Ca2+-binding EF-hand superfamily protein